MAIDVRWYDPENTLLVWTISGTWTLDEFYAAHDDSRRLLYGCTTKVNGILDASGATKRPSTNLLPLVKYALKETPLDTMIYVHSYSHWRFVELLIETAVQITPNPAINRIHFATTLDEALSILTKKHIA